MGSGAIIVKFGGSCLSTSDNIHIAAKKIEAEAIKGEKIVIIVSALSGVTDSLLNLANGATMSKISKEDLDSILSIGERTAVRLMVSALKSLNLESIGIDPELENWPLYTDSNFGNAEVDIDSTEKAVKKKIVPLLEKKNIPVIPGFIGLSHESKITTLGRGGSDISAMVIGMCSDAKEVIFVKDVEGILSADPKKVSSPKKIEQLEVEEAYNLASAGAKVINPKALRYKRNSTILRVVGFNANGLSGGTIIHGELKMGLDVVINPSPLSMVTVITEYSESFDSLSVIFSEISRTSSEVLGFIIAKSSILIYAQNPENLVQNLHEKIRDQAIAKAIHCFDNLAMITVSGYGLENIPGIIDLVISPIADQGINLYGVLTISSSINIFIPWTEREKVVYLIRKNLKIQNGVV